MWFLVSLNLVVAVYKFVAHVNLSREYAASRPDMWESWSYSKCTDRFDETTSENTNIVLSSICSK